MEQLILWLWISCFGFGAVSLFFFVVSLMSMSDPGPASGRSIGVFAATAITTWMSISGVIALWP